MKYISFLAIFVAVALLGGVGSEKLANASTVEVQARLDSDVDYDCGDVRIDFDYQELLPGSDKIVYIFIDTNGDGDYPSTAVAKYNFDNDGQNDSQANFFVQVFDLPADFRIKAVMYDEGAVENNEPAPGAKAEDVEEVKVDREDTCATPVPPTATPVPATPTPVPTATPEPTPTPVVVVQQVPVFIPQQVAPSQSQNQSVVVNPPAQVAPAVAPVVTQGSIKAPNTGDGGLLP